MDSARHAHLQQSKYIKAVKSTGCNGILPYYAQHASLCAARGSLPQKYFETHTMHQIGHWCSCPYVGPSLNQIGSPFDHALFEGAIVVVTDLLPNSCENLLDTALKTSEHTLKGIPSHQKFPLVWFTFSMPKHWSLSWTSMDTHVSFDGAYKSFVWAANQVLVRQKASRGPYLVAWHLLLPKTTRFPFQLRAKASVAFQYHDAAYWNFDLVDMYLPSNEVEYASPHETLCVECESVLNGDPLSQNTHAQTQDTQSPTQNAEAPTQDTRAAPPEKESTDIDSDATEEFGLYRPPESPRLALAI